MNKHKKDSDALLEAFQQIQLQEKQKDEKKDEKKDSDGKYSDHDGKKERCDYVPCEEEAHETPYGGNPEGEDENDEEVQEEMDFSQVSAAHQSTGAVVFQALIDIIGGNMAGLDSPEQMHNFDLNKEFEDSKKAIIDELSDITLSKVKFALKIDDSHDSPHGLGL